MVVVLAGINWGMNPNADRTWCCHRLVHVAMVDRPILLCRRAVKARIRLTHLTWLHLTWFRLRAQAHYDQCHCVAHRTHHQILPCLLWLVLRAQAQPDYRRKNSKWIRFASLSSGDDHLSTKNNSNNYHRMNSMNLSRMNHSNHWSMVRRADHEPDSKHPPKPISES